MQKKGASHSNQLHRLNRIEGQVRGVAKMIEEKRYCVDILQQIKAIKSALAKVEISVLENHIQHCVKRAIASGSEKETQKSIEEVLSLVKK
ncbi:MAG: metal-sensitive transcriptional regulator [Bdellovibrionales bacterium]|nr:metal-sensitive transcriptional regulator [Bdellovibrionales bacterium]